MGLIHGVDAPHALVVGASQGIGLGFVKTLLADATVARLYATYRSPDTAAELLNLAAQQPRLTTVQMDLTDEAQVSQGLAAISAASPRLHLVINSVGMLHTDSQQPEKSLRQINLDNLTHYFQVNSISAILLIKHLQPLLRHGDRSVVATISAKVGSIGDNRLGGWYGYRASKAALNMLIRTAAIEYGRRAPQAILVALHPGTTDTRLSEPFQRNVPPGKLFPVEKTVGLLLEVIRGLQPEDSGEFFSWDGSRLPW
ncbi:MAG: SDR family NAD(P)-dependent oxidoreductase [Cyanobacteria bacterium P01_A01_bin.135]